MRPASSRRSAVTTVGSAATGERLDHAHDGAVVLLAVLGPEQRSEELVDQRRHRQRGATLPCSLEHEAEVLVLERRRAAGPVLAIDQQVTLELERPAAGEAAGEHVEQLADVETAVPAEGHRLGEGGEGGGDDD